ncbi:MAG: multiheme c-type cytochrome, partial [bacterium]
MGMFNPSLNRVSLGSIVKALIMVMIAGAWGVQAAVKPYEVKMQIIPRPLTPQEVKNYGLTNTVPVTQTASGLQNVGVGEPAYLEVLVAKGTTAFPVIATQTVWTLVGRPPTSGAALQPSPLLTNVVASYDTGDRETYNIAGRTKLVPDVKSGNGKSTAMTTFLTNDYVVVARIDYTTATNSFVMQGGVSNFSRTIWLTNVIVATTFEAMTQGSETLNNLGCVTCHDAKESAFNMTQHSSAFTRKVNGEAGAGFKANCVSCHVLGYDTAATNGGFDDVALQFGWTLPTNMLSPAATNNWNLMPLDLQIKANIQCESCHGPGVRHVKSGGVTNFIGISLSGGNCGRCHDSMTHHVKNYQWGQTLHANGGLHTSGSCLPCHTSKGFIEVNKTSTVDVLGNVVTNITRGTLNEGITCAACHDPHTKGMSEYQLRNIPSVTLVNGAVITNGGVGLLCMSCHHDRTVSEDNVNTSSSRGLGAPHHGVQGDMLCGTNGIQYGMKMPSSRHLFVTKDACVTCHMQETPTNGPAMNLVGGHTFMIGWTGPTSTVELTEACAECHGELEGFNFGGEDYDQDGTVEGVQKEVSDMMFQLASMLPPAFNGTNISTTGWTTNAVDYSKRAARYNWLLAYEDGSKGVHNPKYITALLRASIDDLRGGIDVDHDGLRDSWEMQYFGN